MPVSYVIRRKLVKSRDIGWLGKFESQRTAHRVMVSDTLRGNSRTGSGLANEIDKMCITNTEPLGLVNNNFLPSMTSQFSADLSQPPWGNVPVGKVAIGEEHRYLGSATTAQYPLAGTLTTERAMPDRQVKSVRPGKYGQS